MQFSTLWHSKAVHGLNLQASAANLHIVKILRDIEGSFYDSYGIQGLEMTFWALYFDTPVCHSAFLIFLIKLPFFTKLVVWGIFPTQFCSLISIFH